MNLYPLKLKPIFKERIWGGRRLAEVLDKKLPENCKIGESWELSDLPEDKSEIVNGSLAGMMIDTVLGEYGQDITGNADYQAPFPLLIKFLDAKDALSLQVHPDLETCKRTGQGQPKTECWYVIHAPEDGYIYKGLKAGTTREIFEKAILDGTCAEYLNKVPVHVGECHFLPSGTCHAIGPELIIAEIQEPSDTTYRVFDWNRVDPATNQPRQLHIEQALESIHFDDSKDTLTVTTVGRLVDADEFTVDKESQKAGSEVYLSSGFMKAMVVLGGRGWIRQSAGESVEFMTGDTLLIPAVCEGSIRFTDDTEYLIATV